MNNLIKLKFKIILIIILQTLSIEINAQKSLVKIDSVIISYRNLYDVNEDSPPSVDDTSYQNRKVELQLMFNITNPSKIKHIELKFGNEEGSSNFADLNLSYVNEDGIDYLKYNKLKFVIVKNKVIISRKVPQKILKTTGYLTIRSKDVNNTYSNIVSKKIN